MRSHPRAGPIEGAQHLQQGCFAASTRPDNRHKFAVRDFEIDAAQGLHLAFIEFLFQSDRFENIGRACFLCGG